MSKSSRTTNTMQVGFRRLREIKIDHHIHCLHINTSRNQIGTNQKATFLFTLAKLVKHAISIILRHFRVNIKRRKSEFGNLARQQLHTIHTATKNDALIHFELLDQGHQTMHFLRLTHISIKLSHTFQRQIIHQINKHRALVIVHRRHFLLWLFLFLIAAIILGFITIITTTASRLVVVGSRTSTAIVSLRLRLDSRRHMFTDKLLNLRRESGRVEQQLAVDARLAALRNIVQNLLNQTDKVLRQQLVRLVHHDEGALAQQAIAVEGQVQQSSRCRHHQMNLHLFEAQNVLLQLGAASGANHIDAANIFRNLLDKARRLQRQLTSRHQNERLCVLLVDVDQLQHWNGIRASLARAILGATHHIVAHQNVGDALLLHGRWPLKPKLENTAQQFLVEREVGKRGALRLGHVGSLDASILLGRLNIVQPVRRVIIELAIVALDQLIVDGDRIAGAILGIVLLSTATTPSAILSASVVVILLLAIAALLLAIIVATIALLIVAALLTAIATALLLWLLLLDVEYSCDRRDT
mmetsp:Transcript_36454/g.59938  ORF Transcript_36454/g.59938 Transcript_36454/m.59938 type:complete len:527 (+) Transcript_36454:180-1760(+)